MEFESMKDMGSSGEVTGLLSRWHQGDRQALGPLVDRVYKELHRAARGYLSRERKDHSLPPTALVHETFLRFFNCRNMRFENRTQFFWFAGHLMGQILTDHARTRCAVKRFSEKVGLDPDSVPALQIPLNVNHETLLSLDRALARLRIIDPRQVSIVELRFFLGLNLEEVARAMEISPTTVKREWHTAKRWLARELDS